MPLQPDYTTVSNLKAYLTGMEGTTQYDTLLGQIITRVSRQMDRYCRRAFGSETATTHGFETRTSMVFLNPLLRTISSLSVDGVVWDAAQYHIPLHSVGSAADDAGPYAQLVLQPYNYRDYFMRAYDYFAFYNRLDRQWARLVSVTGDWGFASVPSEIEDAAIILAAREFKARDAAFSDVIGTSDMGTPIFSKALPQNVKLILDSYKPGPKL